MLALRSLISFAVQMSSNLKFAILIKSDAATLERRTFRSWHFSGNSFETTMSHIALCTLSARPKVEGRLARAKWGSCELTCRTRSSSKDLGYGRMRELACIGGEVH